MADPLFVNERLPDSIEQGAKGGPGFKTTIIELASGHEARNGEWGRQRLQWDIGYGIQSKEDTNVILDWFYVCMGQLHGFRFKDWSDYVIGSPNDDLPQEIAVGNNSTKIFQAVRTYSVGSYSFLRKITRLVAGTVRVFVDDVEKTVNTDYTVDIDTGLITFVNAPGNLTSIGLIAEFDVPVRFDTDLLSMEVTLEDAEAIPQIMIKELKE